MLFGDFMTYFKFVFYFMKNQSIVAGITWLPCKDIPVSHNFTRAKKSGAAIHDDYGSHSQLLKTCTTLNPLTPEIRNIDFRHIKPYIFLKALCYLIQIHRKNM